MSDPLVLVVCGDAGGAEAVAPVVAELGAAGTFVTRAYLYEQAPQTWSRRGWQFDAADAYRGKSAAAAIADFKPSLLLTGTSMNDQMIELDFVSAARAAKIPSIAILDSWVNYAERFTDREGRRVWPDRVAVMDASAADALVAAGADRHAIDVTGQPALDALAGARAAFSAEQRALIRHAWGVTSDELAVLFVSQPLSELYESQVSFGFNEHIVAAAVAAALQGLGRRVALVIRPHPREDAAKFSDLSSTSVRIVIDRASNSREAVMSADLVAGMNSILLLEASVLGQIALSLQPGLERDDVLPSNASGTTVPVYAMAGVEPAIRHWLLDEPARASHRALLAARQPGSGAAARVAALAQSMIRKHSPKDLR